MAVRYKIKVSSEKAYQEVRETLRAKNVQVFVASEKRRTISAGSMSDSLILNIKEHGATVSLDQQYDLESRKRA